MEGYNSGIIVNYYRDSNNNPIIKTIQESQQVNSISNTIQLLEIPSTSSSVAILNKSMIRVWNYEDIINENHYYVNEENGFIYFHPQQASSTMTIKYGSIGGIALSAGRVYTNLDSNGDIVQTLQGLIEKGYIAIDSLNTIGDASVIVLQLKEDIRTGVDLHELLDRDIQLGTPISNDLSANIPIAEQINSNMGTNITRGNTCNSVLNTTINEGKALNTNLNTTIDSGEVVGIALQSTIDGANNTVNLIQGTDNKTFTIATNQWVEEEKSKYTYVWTHTLNSQNLQVTTYKNTLNGRESVLIPYIVTDNNRIKFISDTNGEIVVVVNARYYGGSVASLSTFTADDLPEGIRNRYVKSDYLVTTHQLDGTRGVVKYEKTPSGTIIARGNYTSSALAPGNLTESTITLPFTFVGGIESFICTIIENATDTNKELGIHKVNVCGVILGNNSVKIKWSDINNGLTKNDSFKASFVIIGS